jgi:phosphate:Na+ symporter
LVSFAETQLITLTQAISLILGADIGTTFVVILLSFQKITEYSLVLVAIGVLVEMVAKKRKLKYMGRIVLGFGLIFFGMHMMSQAAYPLRESEVAAQIFGFLASHPGWNLLFATLFTAVIQTSAATIGIAIALSFAGVIGFEAAVPIVLGANVGTCITAILASAGSGVRGRRVAFAHLLVKVVAVGLVFPFIGQYAAFVAHISAELRSVFPFVSAGISGEIALTHLIFNIILALLFAPFVVPLGELVQKMMPIKKEEEEDEIKPKYLDEAALDTPTLAFAQAKREVLRVAGFTNELFLMSLDMYKKNVNIDDEAEKIGTLDDKIDILEKAVRFYFAKLSQGLLTAEQADTELNLLAIASDLEDIGDIISKEMLLLARKKSKKMRLFSEEGWQELNKFHKLVQTNFDLMISMLIHPHEDIAMKVARHEEHLNSVEQDLRQSHLRRLHDGLFETFETSSIHLDVLGNMRMINAKVTKIVKISEQIA